MFDVSMSGFGYGHQMTQGGLDTRHQRYLSSQHFYTRVALRNSETTSWSKAEGTGFHKKARKVTYLAVGFINYLQIEPATASDTSATLQPWTVGLLDNCELGGSSCDSSIMLSVCRPVIILLQASKLVLQSKNHCMNLFMTVVTIVHDFIWRL